jgi:hypothetical protein
MHDLMAGSNFVFFYSEALGINDIGEVVGWIQNDDTNFTQEGFIYEGGQTVDFSHSASMLHGLSTTLVGLWDKAAVLLSPILASSFAICWVKSFFRLRWRGIRLPLTTVGR